MDAAINGVRLASDRKLGSVPPAPGPWLACNWQSVPPSRLWIPWFCLAGLMSKETQLHHLDPRQLWNVWDQGHLPVLLPRPRPGPPAHSAQLSLGSLCGDQGQWHPGALGAESTPAPTSRASCKPSWGSQGRCLATAYPLPGTPVYRRPKEAFHPLARNSAGVHQTPLWPEGSCDPRWHRGPQMLPVCLARPKAKDLRPVSVGPDKSFLNTDMSGRAGLHFRN